MIQILLVIITENGNNTLITDNTDITQRQLCGYCPFGMLPGQLPTIVAPSKTSVRTAEPTTEFHEMENVEEDLLTAMDLQPTTTNTPTTTVATTTNTTASIQTPISSLTINRKDITDAPVKKRLYK